MSVGIYTPDTDWNFGIVLPCIKFMPEYPGHFKIVSFLEQPIIL
jgi:hypothetical protein